MSDQPDLFLGDASSSAHEHAVTPAWLVRQSLSACFGPMLPNFRRILDPGAGTGAIAREVERLLDEVGWEQRPGDQRRLITAIDILPERQAAWPEHWVGITDDFLRWEALTTSDHTEALRLGEEGNDLIFCNPPFSAWHIWARACLRLLAPGGHLLMVGPLAYLAGQEHYRGLWKMQPPRDVCVAVVRPRGPGWDNTREIGVARWHEGSGGPTRLRWLPGPGGER